MQGFLGTLIGEIIPSALGPGLALIAMVAPPKRVARAQLKKVYVLNENGDMTGEYVLDPDCPIDYNDFLKVLPDDGIGDQEVLFVGEYVFTAFQSGKFVFVLLSRGQLAPEDVEWTATLLTAADAHLAAQAGGPSTDRSPEPPKTSPDTEKALADREARIEAREKEVAKTEAQLEAAEANLKGRAEELDRQKAQLSALADYVAQLQGTVASGVNRARQSLEMAEQLAASSEDQRQFSDNQAYADLEKHFDDERKALLLAKTELEGKYREATEQVQDLQAKVTGAEQQLQQERGDAAAREVEAEKLRTAIEVRVQELSQRFASMAKERLVNSHKPAMAPQEEKHDDETAKTELARERQFLQQRAIELGDREEKTRGRETALDQREAALAKREEELGTREARLVAEASRESPAAADAEEARKDIERRVKIIQQKALDLLDREEKLRKRAAELEALEARLSGRVPAR